MPEHEHGRGARRAAKQPAGAVSGRRRTTSASARLSTDCTAEAGASPSPKHPHGCARRASTNVSTASPA